jgi:hypothetical protein
VSRWGSKRRVNARAAGEEIDCRDAIDMIGQKGPLSFPKIPSGGDSRGFATFRKAEAQEGR